MLNFEFWWRVFGPHQLQRTRSVRHRNSTFKIHNSKFSFLLPPDSGLANDGA
jgi:hypothetical protein